jgi:hypothetical protein
MGTTDFAGQETFSLANSQFRNQDSFFLVFAIIFPAFTGMTAGVGLSGDLKKPSKSIPIGTIIATISGMIIYFFVTYKLANNASVDDLLNNQLIMSKIAIWGFVVVPLGLAASTISSAIGSVMVAPRTLQALSSDRSFPLRSMNKFLSKERVKDNEPFNASLVTCIIALFFVAIGDVNMVAQIISMFFMVTYGALCLISFLNHFGSSPSYRPSFRSRWYLSLLGFFISLWVMFKISAPYAILAIVLMILLNIYINSYHRKRKGLASIFTNVIFQVNRKLQVFLQKSGNKKTFSEWRPSAICISESSFERNNAYQLLNWISYKYGFGTYLHRIEGYYSKNTYEQANVELKKLIKNMDDRSNSVYIDTIISPSYTSAIAQAIQIPGISGMENNMVIFEFDKGNPRGLADIIDNFNLVHAGKFDVCILGSSRRPVLFRNGIHVWIKTLDTDNANLMILISFIISGHPAWHGSNISIFHVSKLNEVKETRDKMNDLVNSGRLPISLQNIQIIVEKEGVSAKDMINERSADAGLTILGFRSESINHLKEKLFEGYEDLGNILFINSHNQKIIE